MHTRHSTRLTAVTLALGLMSAASAVPSGAQTRMIDRSCEATLFARIVGEMGGGALFTFDPAITDIWPPHQFDCQGRCGALVPNRCRQRASEVGFKCMRALAGHPDSESNFEEECPSYTAGLPASNVTRMFHFTVRDETLSAYLQNYVCAAANQWYDRYTPDRGHAAVIRYEIHGRTWGDSGCGGASAKSKTEKLAAHDMTCERERNATSDAVLMDTYLCEARGWICTPNIEYRRWALAQPDHQLCRGACLGDGQCMAWQYDPPKSDDPKAYCKLVDHYPQIGGKRVGTVAGMK